MRSLSTIFGIIYAYHPYTRTSTTVSDLFEFDWKQLHTVTCFSHCENRIKVVRCRHGWFWLCFISYYLFWAYTFREILCAGDWWKANAWKWCDSRRWRWFLFVTFQLFMLWWQMTRHWSKVLRFVCFFCGAFVVLYIYKFGHVVIW